MFGKHEDNKGCGGKGIFGGIKYEHKPMRNPEILTPLSQTKFPTQKEQIQQAVDRQNMMDAMKKQLEGKFVEHQFSHENFMRKHQEMLK